MRATCLPRHRSSKQRPTSFRKSDCHFPKLSFTYTTGRCACFMCRFKSAICRAVRSMAGIARAPPSNWNSLIMSMMRRQELAEGRMSGMGWFMRPLAASVSGCCEGLPQNVGIRALVPRRQDAEGLQKGERLQRRLRQARCSIIAL